MLEVQYDIAHLIDLLRGYESMNVRALVLTRLLADDPNGMLIRPRHGEDLKQVIGEIIRAL